MFEELKELELLEIDGGCRCKTGEVCRRCTSPKMFFTNPRD